MAPRAARHALLSTTLGLVAAVHVSAASLQVAPTTITLAARQNADGLWLSNTGDASMHAQVRVYRWTQVDGEDRLDPTRDIAVSPPMVELPAGQRQLVRIIRLGPPPADTEVSYRVIVDELPASDTERSPDNAGKRTRLDFVLRYSVPVFLLPAIDSAPSLQPELSTKTVRTGADLQLEIGNGGAVHAQISELVFVDAGGRRHTIREGLAGYVLPGERKRWSLPAALTDSAALSGTFKARVNGEFADRELLPRGIEGARPGSGR